VIGRGLVFEAIKRRRIGKTTIVITHDLAHIDSDDYVYVLRQGICVEQGSRRRLENHPFSEFSHMLREQGICSNIPSSMVKREVDAVPLTSPSSIRIRDAFPEYTETIPEVNEENIMVEKDIVPPPLTTNGWMFDVISDLTMPISPPTTTPTERRKSIRRYSRRSSITPIKHSPTKRFSASELPVAKEDPNVRPRPRSYQKEPMEFCVPEPLTEDADTILEIDEEKTLIDKNTVLHPLKTSGWMFDVISDLTTPISSAVTVPTERWKSIQCYSRRSPTTPIKHSPTKRFSASKFLAMKEDSNARTRPHSCQEEPPEFYLPELLRRRSMDFEPADAPKVSREDALERQKTAMDMYEKRAVTKQPRRAWNPDMLKAVLESENIVECVAPQPVEAPSQPSIPRLMYEVWPTLASHWRVMFGVILSVIAGMMMPLFSFILSRLQYELTNGAARMAVINTFGGASLGLAALYGVLHGLQYFILETTGIVWVNKLRRITYDLILSQDQKWFDRNANKPAQIIQMLVKNGDGASQLFATVLTGAISTVVMVLVGIIWAFVTGWQLTLLASGLIPIFIVLTGVQLNLISKCEYRNKCAREEVAQGYYDVSLFYLFGLQTTSYSGQGHH
jgi:hypothetical protein